MDFKINHFRYLSPIIGILFCPVTILFLWSFWSGPILESDSDLVEEIER